MSTGGAQTRARTPRRQWSTTRTVSGVAFLITTLSFVIVVLIQPRRGLNDLPQIALDVFRGYWIIALAAALLATAYDRVAPKLFSRLASLREGVRALELSNATLVDLVREQAAEMAQVRQAALRNAMAAERRALLQEECLAALVDKMAALTTQVTEREVEEYAKGFNSALDRIHLHIPHPTPSPDDHNGAIPITAGRRRGL